LYECGGMSSLECVKVSLKADRYRLPEVESMAIDDRKYEWKGGDPLKDRQLLFFALWNVFCQLIIIVGAT
jgi:hypothetical protein